MSITLKNYVLTKQICSSFIKNCFEWLGFQQLQHCHQAVGYSLTLTCWGTCSPLSLSTSDPTLFQYISKIVINQRLRLSIIHPKSDSSMETLRHHQRSMFHPDKEGTIVQCVESGGLENSTKTFNSLCGSMFILRFSSSLGSLLPFCFAWGSQNADDYVIHDASWVWISSPHGNQSLCIQAEF